MSHLSFIWHSLLEAILQRDGWIGMVGTGVTSATISVWAGLLVAAFTCLWLGTQIYIKWSDHIRDRRKERLRHIETGD